jgi:hypothetical protein
MAEEATQIEPTDVVEEAPTRKKQPARKTIVTLANRTPRGLVIPDANGNGLHIPPKGSVQVEAKLADSPDIARHARMGFIHLS